MMRDVDALSCMYDPLIQHYNTIAANQLLTDQMARPHAYMPQPIDDLTHSFAPLDPHQSSPQQPMSPMHTIATLTTLTNIPPWFHSPPLQPPQATITLNLTKPSLDAATPHHSCSPCHYMALNQQWLCRYSMPASPPLAPVRPPHN